MTADDRLQYEVAAALAQDVDANFERLVTTYGDRVFAFVLNLVADLTYFRLDPRIVE